MSYQRLIERRTIWLVPDQQPDRRRVIGVTWIIQLRAVRNEHYHIHFSFHLYILSGGGYTIHEIQAAVFRHGHVHEEIDIAGEVALAHAAALAYRIMRQRMKKIVAATVHRKFIQPVPHSIRSEDR